MSFQLAGENVFDIINNDFVCRLQQMNEEKKIVPETTWSNCRYPFNAEAIAFQWYLPCKLNENENKCIWRQISLTKAKKKSKPFNIIRNISINSRLFLCFFIIFLFYNDDHIKNQIVATIYIVCIVNAHECKNKWQNKDIWKKPPKKKNKK